TSAWSRSARPGCGGSGRGRWSPPRCGPPAGAAGPRPSPGWRRRRLARSPPAPGRARLLPARPPPGRPPPAPPPPAPRPGPAPPPPGLTVPPAARARGRLTPTGGRPAVSGGPGERLLDGGRRGFQVALRADPLGPRPPEPPVAVPAARGVDVPGRAVGRRMGHLLPRDAAGRGDEGHAHAPLLERSGEPFEPVDGGPPLDPVSCRMSHLRPRLPLWDGALVPRG